MIAVKSDTFKFPYSSGIYSYGISCMMYLSIALIVLYVIVINSWNIIYKCFAYIFNLRWLFPFACKPLNTQIHTHTLIFLRTHTRTQICNIINNDLVKSKEPSDCNDCAWPKLWTEGGCVGQVASCAVACCGFCFIYCINMFCLLLVLLGPTHLASTY